MHVVGLPESYGPYWNWTNFAAHGDRNGRTDGGPPQQGRPSKDLVMPAAGMIGTGEARRRPGDCTEDGGGQEVEGQPCQRN